jgi:hypothetical protein
VGRIEKEVELMPRKQQSEFHKRVQEGTGYDTLKSGNICASISETVTMIQQEYPDWTAWEALCSIRYHVEALIGAQIDLDSAHQQAILTRAQSGEFKDNPQAGIDLLNSKISPTIDELYAEVKRQGIPEWADAKESKVGAVRYLLSNSNFLKRHFEQRP